MAGDLKALISKSIKGDARSISRLISLSEDQPLLREKIVKEVYKHGGKSHIIGITGAPGAGKSTLVDKIAIKLSNSGSKVAIVAVDPSSPFSGGAILGDRIRMSGITDYPDIFVRSQASRGALGGLSHATLASVYILEAAGYEYVLIETVGVGQGEVDIARFAETCLVVLVPGMGDEIQSVKAGILEIADIFVINKSEREGANILEKDLLTLISLVDYEKSDWKSPVVKTVAPKESGVDELLKKMEAHKKWAYSSKNAESKKEKIMQNTILQLAAERIKIEINLKSSKILKKLSKLCLEKKTDPYSASIKLIKSSR
jgi:LAO/AO transport system kinase